MEQREMQKFSFSDIRIHPNLITDILEKGGDMSLTLRKEGDRITISFRQTYSDGNTEQMALEDVMEKTISVFRHFEENADSIMSELKPGWNAGLLEVMNRLAKRLEAVADESDLLAIANIMHDLTIEIPRFPPDDNPPEHFRPEHLEHAPETVNRREQIEHHRAALNAAFRPCFERIEQAWRNLPSIIPETVSKGRKEPDWDMIRRIKEDPEWDEFFDEIERERDRHMVWTEGGAA